MIPRIRSDTSQVILATNWVQVEALAACLGVYDG
jgi:hypothetical protein